MKVLLATATVALFSVAMPTASLAATKGSPPATTTSRAAAPITKATGVKSTPSTRPTEIRSVPRAEFARRASPVQPKHSRVKPIPLPYKAIPSARLKEAAKPALLTRDLQRRYKGSRITMNGVDGRTNIDIRAGRQNGEKHYEKRTGQTIRLPQKMVQRRTVNYDRTGFGREKWINGPTTAPSIADLRTARRYVERHGPRSQPRAEARVRGRR